MSQHFTRDELVEALRLHRAEIIQADEWRPLADHVLAFLSGCRAALAEAEKERDQGHADIKWLLNNDIRNKCIPTDELAAIRMRLSEIRARWYKP